MSFGVISSAKTCHSGWSAAKGRNPVNSCLTTIFYHWPRGILDPGLAAYAANRDDKSGRALRIGAGRLRRDAQFPPCSGRPMARPWDPCRAHSWSKAICLGECAAWIAGSSPRMTAHAGFLYQTIGQIGLKQAENTLFPDRMPTESTPNCGLSNAKPNQIWLNWGKSSAKINESPKMNPR